MTRPTETPKPGSLLSRWRDPATKHDLIIEMEFGVINGRVAPHAVTIRSPDGAAVAITAAIVRRVPVGAMTDDYLQQAREGLMRLASDRGVNDSTRAAAEDLAQRHGPHRGRQLTADELQEVAEAYRYAYRVGLPVQQYVADRFGIPKSTAAKRIGLARTAGYLGPANGRQAGEKPATIKKGRAR